MVFFVGGFDWFVLRLGWVLRLWVLGGLFWLSLVGLWVGGL